MHDKMRLYIGTKVLLAVAMTRGDYNDMRGWTLPPDESSLDGGYLVQYSDGYKSWSPRKQFEEAYQTFDAMNFGHALQVLKDGKRVSRAGWNGKGMWLCLSPGGMVPANKFWAPNNKAFAQNQPDGLAEVLPYITMKTADNKIVPWLASQTDVLAEDWGVVE